VKVTECSSNHIAFTAKSIPEQVLSNPTTRVVLSSRALPVLVCISTTRVKMCILLSHG
jgi:hypothetical protein